MSRIYCDSQNAIIFKRRWEYLFVSIITSALAAFIGYITFTDLIPPVDTFTFSDFIAITIATLWCVLSLFIGIYGVTFAFKRLTVDSSGIICNSLLSRKEIKWNELADYGISYSNYTRWEGNTYYLYFSKTPLKTKNGSKKKLCGQSIKMFVFEGDLDGVRNLIFPFCRSQTELEPFIGQKTHWWEKG